MKTQSELANISDEIPQNQKTEAQLADNRESVSFGDRNKDFSKEPMCLSGRGVTRVFHTGKTTTVAVDGKVTTTPLVVEPPPQAQPVANP